MVKKKISDLDNLYNKLHKMYPNDSTLYDLVKEIVELEIELEGYCGG